MYDADGKKRGRRRVGSQTDEQEHLVNFLENSNFFVAERHPKFSLFSLRRLATLSSIDTLLTLQTLLSDAISDGQ
jgi:hypothetical protein